MNEGYRGPSEKAMTPHSSTPAWKIPWTEEPGGLQSRGLLRVGHNWATSLSLLTFMRWRRKWQPTPVFLPGESQGRGAWWAAVYGVTQSQTWLKWLSSSSIEGLSVGFLQKLPASNLSNKNISLIVCAAFKTCPAHGWLSSAIPKVGTGEEVRAGHFNFKWNNKMGC